MCASRRSKINSVAWKPICSKLFTSRSKAARKHGQMQGDWIPCDGQADRMQGAADSSRADRSRRPWRAATAADSRGCWTRRAVDGRPPRQADAVGREGKTNGGNGRTNGDERQWDWIGDSTSCACEKNYSSDTILGICNLHYQGAKGHIYSTCTGRKYAENPLTDGENTIYNIHLTTSSLDFCIHTWHNKISVYTDELWTEKPEHLREHAIPEYAHLNWRNLACSQPQKDTPGVFNNGKKKIEAWYYGSWNERWWLAPSRPRARNRQLRGGHRAGLETGHCSLTRRTVCSLGSR
jgi:hypothetical protein